MFNQKKVAFFLPTYNGEKQMQALMTAVQEAKDWIDQLYAIDSGSSDATVQILEENGFIVDPIDKTNFTHGRVRHLAMEKLQDVDYVILATQDVEPTTGAFKSLVTFLDAHEKMLSAYGKQEVDLSKGNLFEARSRAFNYPDKSIVKDKNAIPKLGIKTIFQSDAFVVYRRDLVMAIGNFPEEINFAEDQYMAATAILKGYTIGYCAEAVVYHQHNYTLKEEYERFKAAGEFNKSYASLLKNFGSNESEGVKYVKNELAFYWKNGHKKMIPRFIAINVAKYLGYRLG